MEYILIYLFLALPKLVVLLVGVGVVHIGLSIAKADGEKLKAPERGRAVRKAIVIGCIIATVGLMLPSKKDMLVIIGGGYMLRSELLNKGLEVVDKAVEKKLNKVLAVE